MGLQLNYVSAPCWKLSSKKEPLLEVTQRVQVAYLALYPEIIAAYFQVGLMARACSQGLVEPCFIQIRDFAQDRHRTVDDLPFGGGSGMVLRVDVLYQAWERACAGLPKPTTVLLSPQGRVLNHSLARELAARKSLVFVCGRYEGIDERFTELCVDCEISIGDYVLSGGEMAAVVATDAICRFLPGFVGKEESVANDSFEQEGLLKFPQYTRPREFMGKGVPDVLVRGDHEAIARWRQEQRIARTRERRPDLRQNFLPAEV